MQHGQVLIKRRTLETETAIHTGRALREHQGRDQGDACTSQGIPKIVCKPLEARRAAWNRVSLTPLSLSEETSPADTSFSDLRPQEPGDNTLCLSPLVCSICFGSPSKLMHALFPILALQPF